MQDKSMLKSAFILTAGNIISRFLGLIYVFPFAWLVGQEGQALFSYAYVPYIIFIDLATLGIPLGISKFVSIYNAQNDYQTSYKVFKKATVMMFLMGIVMFLVMFLVSKPIAYEVLGRKEKLINNINDVTLVIRVISTALIIVPSIALLRGFFQGFKYSYQTATSQIVEQLVRVSFILIASYLIIKVYNLPYTTAIIVSVASATIAALFAYIYLRVNLTKLLVKIKPLVDNSITNQKKSTYQLFKELFKYALPIALFGLVSSLYIFIDTLTFNKAYIQNGISNSEIIYGTYAFEINKLIMIPVSLGMGLGVSIIIYISESYTKRHFSLINKQIYKALQTCAYLIIPIIILMMIFPKGVYSLLFQANNPYGPKILLSYAPVAILLCFNHIINAIMQGINKMGFLTISMILGVSLKYLYNVDFITKFGYNGAILATTIALLTTIIINFIKISKTLNFDHLYIVRRLLVILILNLTIGFVLYIINFHIIELNINYYNRLHTFLYLTINTFIYISVYLLISYYSGLLDVISGQNFSFKRLIKSIQNKIML